MNRSALSLACLVLVGADARGSRRTLARLAKRLGIAADVLILDAAFGADRANLLAAADVFVHPSRWEGVSLSVLAAAVAGKACVLTHAADPLGVLARADAAVVVEPTAASIARGLTDVLALPVQARIDMGRRARDAVHRQFSWRSAAEALIHAYRQAARGVG